MTLGNVIAAKPTTAATHNMILALVTGLFEIFSNIS